MERGTGSLEYQDDARHGAPTLQTPEMAIKELWVYLLAYNLIRILMAQAGSAGG